MRGILLLSLLLLSTTDLAWSGTNDAEDCCLSVTNLIIPRHIVCAYRRLSPENGCRLPAVVFTTQKGYQLCAPPDRLWVKRLIKRLDKNNSQPQLQLVLGTGRDEERIRPSGWKYLIQQPV
ncbi:C-C motif chemokine 19 isoform X1 [Vombatus ursinus]|uniref:C-C motif chemokine 19 isoform X1 n=1 Tax=Vombatus ursinus TaxID=29139 RepID=UPI000FFD6DF3|nr:C-C motif chemokine 19 isoform X1 [Vombatus ursinus]